MGDHGDRDGGSKCVTTGSICVPKNIMILKSLKVQEKSFQAFVCVYLNAIELHPRGGADAFLDLN